MIHSWFLFAYIFYFNTSNVFLLLIYWFLIYDYLSSIFILGKCDAISVFLNCIITSFCFLSFLIYFLTIFFFLLLLL